VQLDGDETAALRLSMEGVRESVQESLDIASQIR
jgi:hypothetical protein